VPSRSARRLQCAVAGVAVVVGVACGMLRPGLAFASGLSAAEFGGEHGNVVTTDPTAIYFNPAGLALGEGTRVYVSGILALRRGSWTHTRAASEAADPPGAAGADTGQARFSNVLAAPALAVTTWLRRLALGAGFYVPFGGNVAWDHGPRLPSGTDFPLAADGVQRWHIIDGSVRSLYFTLGAGLRLGPVALGVTGNLIRSSVAFRQARSFSGMPVDPRREGRTAIDVAGWQASVGLGVMVEAVPERLWVGASYQAQPGFGPIQLDGTLTITDETGASGSRAITYTSALPEIVRGGIRLRLDGLLPKLGQRPLELRAYGDLTRWSRLQSQCISLEGQPCAVFADGTDATPAASTVQNIRRRWKDTYGVNLAASYWPSAALELFAGVGYATAATPDATLDPMLPDASNVRFTVGTRVAVGPGWHVTAGLTDVQFASRDNTGRSILSDAEIPTRRADGGGRYTLWLGIFHLALEIPL
jgi:long-chain fatty acid transport protein